MKHACCGAALGFGMAFGAAIPHPLIMILGAIAFIGFTIMGLIEEGPPQ